MKKVSFDSIVRDPYLDNIIVRNDFPGFMQDYLVISSLIRRFDPVSLVEIGTSSGSGTRVIARAMGLKQGVLGMVKNRHKKLYSIDVPPGTDPSIIYPGKEDGHPEQAGALCDFPYYQLFGDSTTYDFSALYPIEAWFIDGKHNYKYARLDTLQALKSEPKLIMWHDADIPEVSKAINAVMNKQSAYNTYRVSDSRLAYAVLKSHDK
jgi:hypothetical protein